MGKPVNKTLRIAAMSAGEEIGHVSGPIVTFRGNGDPLRSLLVNIDPVQDLHGYDSPWPSGGGANKANLETATVRNDGTYGMSVTIDKTAETITMSGTWTGAAVQSWRFLNTPDIDTSLSIKAFELTSGSHISSVTQDGAENRLIIQLNNMVSGTAYTISFKLFAYSGTAPTSWTPYSNICPISGWSAVNVWRTGKNLLDVDKYGITLPRTQNGITWSKVRDGVYHASGTATGSSYFNLSFYSEAQSAMPCISFRGQRMTLSSTDVHIIPSIAYFVEDGSFKQLSNGGIIPDNAVGLRAYVRIGKDTDIDTDFSVQLELGSTATPYEPYQGDTYTIQLGDTVYGGTLDVINGVLTVDTQINEYDGDEGWSLYSGATHSFFLNIGTGSDRPIDTNRDGIMSYAKRNNASPASAPDWVFTVQGGQRLVITTESNIDTVAKWKTYLSNNHLQYLMPLATPITIPLTPQEISTLQGKNNVWADTGDVDVEYIATGGEGGKLALLLRNRKELLIALRKGLTPAEAGLLNSTPLLGGFVRPGLSTDDEKEEDELV